MFASVFIFAIVHAALSISQCALLQSPALLLGAAPIPVLVLVGLLLLRRQPVVMNTEGDHHAVGTPDRPAGRLIGSARIFADPDGDDGPLSLAIGL